MDLGLPAPDLSALELHIQDLLPIIELAELGMLDGFAFRYWEAWGTLIFANVGMKSSTFIPT